MLEGPSAQTDWVWLQFWSRAKIGVHAVKHVVRR